MSLTENDKVMVYGNKAERLPTLAELSEYFKSNTSGNVATASKLATARDLTFSGAATGTGSFDGSQAVDFELTLAPVSATNVNIEEDADIGVYGSTLQDYISNLVLAINELTYRVEALEPAE